MFSRFIAWIKSLFKREPEPEELVQEYIEDVKKIVHTRPGPRGIRSTDLGMRKLRRHRSGRLHDRRSGFDPDKRMIDIEDDQTRKSKKRTWFEDRKRA